MRRNSKLRTLAISEVAEETATQQSQPSISFVADESLIYIRYRINLYDGDIFEDVVKEIMANENFDGNIYLSINSPGGSLDDTLSIIAQMHELQKEGIKFHATAKTTCASGACMILIEADYRHARAFSKLMYHPPLFQTEPLLEGMIIDLALIRDYEKEIANSWKYMKEQLQRRTKLTDKQINKIFKSGKDFNMTVEEALEYGFIDDIL